MPLESIPQIQRPTSKLKKKKSNSQRCHTIHKFALADKFYYLKNVVSNLKTTLDFNMLVNLSTSS